VGHRDVVRSALRVVLTVAAAMSCGAASTAVPTPPTIPQPAPAAPEARPPSLPAWIYWEPVEAAVGAAAEPATQPPLRADELVRSPGAEARWVSAPPAVREAVASLGFAVTPSPHASLRVGDFYASLRDDRVPWVVTLDALFFLAHLAFDRALADVDAAVVAPSMARMLARLEERLAAEARVARPDTIAASSVARGLVAVARALAPDDAGGPAPPELSALAAREKARVLSHAGWGRSEALGAAVDYSALALRGAADRDAAAAGRCLAAAWLQNAVLTLEGAGERDVRAHVDVATARVHARAALMIARLLDRDVDPDAATAWERIERAGELVTGDAEDVTPRDLVSAASRAELDVRGLDWLANVVRVDRVRHAAARGRVSPSFRLLSPRSTPDGELLQALTYPGVGPRTRPGAPETARGPRATDRDGVRALPTALDVASWLGSGEARAALHESGDDAYEGYDDALERLVRARPPDGPLAIPGRHRTPYLSMIDAIETWLAPSAGDAVQPSAATAEWRMRKARVALAAWTELRHDATALTRLAVPDVRLPARAPAASTVPIFVEPHPEAIAKLLAFVRQTQQALVGEGMLPAGAPAVRALEEIDDLLWTALGVAVYETADEAPPPSLGAELAAFPARLRALESVLSDSGAADVPLAIDVHVDLPSARVLEEATEPIEEAWIAMREPGTHRLWLALGASIPHVELVEPASRRPSDAAWRARLRADGEPPEAP